MKDCISINNFKGNGAIGISRTAIAHIAYFAVKDVPGADVVSHNKRGLDAALDPLFFLPPSGVKVAFSKDDRAIIHLEVAIKKGSNVADTAEKIQESVAMAIGLMCDVVPFDIQVKVARIV